jgi:hypothetical protein
MNLKETYMQAIPRIGINIRRVLTDMFKPQIRKTGKMAKVKSQTTEMALYKNVSAMMTSTGTQVPFLIFLFQKKEIGLHCKSVTKKKTRPVSASEGVLACL